MELDDEVMARDVFPAEVLLPDGSLLTRCRVFVTSHRLLAFKEDKAKRIECVAHLELSKPHSIDPNKATLQMTGRINAKTTEGEVIINRARGCSCGSLKALDLPCGWTRRKKVA
jgi:hypothetical protein